MHLQRTFFLDLSEPPTNLLLDFEIFKITAIESTKRVETNSFLVYNAVFRVYFEENIY